MIYKTTFPLLFSALFVVSCGGGSGDDKHGVGVIAATEPTVAIDMNNGPNLAIAATEGAIQATNSDNLPTNLPTGSNSDIAGSRAISTKKLESRARQTLDCNALGLGTGSIVSDISDDLQAFTFVYSCTDISGSYSGSYIPNVENWTSFSASYDNFHVDGALINGSVTCTRTSTTAIDVNCTYGFNNIDGLNGKTYSISNSSVSGDNSTGYSISATVTDPATGAVNFSTTNLTLGNCAYGVPNSGTLKLSGLNETVATVTYNDCESFTLLDVNGSANVYKWADLVN